MFKVLQWIDSLSANIRRVRLDLRSTPAAFNLEVTPLQQMPSVDTAIGSVAIDFGTVCIDNNDDVDKTLSTRLRVPVECFKKFPNATAFSLALNSERHQLVKGALVHSVYSLPTTSYCGMLKQFMAERRRQTSGVTRFVADCRFRHDDTLDKLKDLFSDAVGMSLTDGSLTVNFGAPRHHANSASYYFESSVIEYDYRDVGKPKVVIKME